MVLVQKRSPRRTALFIGLLAVIVIGGGLALWYLLQPAAPTRVTPMVTGRRDLPIFDSFGEEFLRSEEAQSLRSFGNLPVRVDPYGNPNPFEQRF